MKKILSIVLVLCACIGILSLAGCSKEEDTSEVRIAVYNTKYNGNLLHQYPDFILTDTKVLDMIENSTGTGPIEDYSEIVVLHKLIYYNDAGEEITVIIQNIGKVTFMNIGLPQQEYYLTDSELHNVLLEITGATAE